MQVIAISPESIKISWVDSWPKSIKILAEKNVSYVQPINTENSDYSHSQGPTWWPVPSPPVKEPSKIATSSWWPTNPAIIEHLEKTSLQKSSGSSLCFTASNSSKYQNTSADKDDSMRDNPLERSLFEGEASDNAWQRFSQAASTLTEESQSIMLRPTAISGDYEQSGQSRRASVSVIDALKTIARFAADNHNFHMWESLVTNGCLN